MPDQPVEVSQIAARQSIQQTLLVTQRHRCDRSVDLATCCAQRQNFFTSIGNARRSDEKLPLVERKHGARHHGLVHPAMASNIFGCDLFEFPHRGQDPPLWRRNAERLRICNREPAGHYLGKNI
jgi:hypothetical protein